MPRLSRDDTWRVIEALQQFVVLDPPRAARLEVARVLERLTQRARQAGAGPLPAVMQEPSTLSRQDVR